jgi:arsenate reductase
MRELGIDLSAAAGHRAEGMDEFTGQPPMDLVVTVCDGATEQCPFFPGVRRQEHWGFPDPSAATGAEGRLAVFHQIQDAIAGRVEEFARTIGDR